jgi:hypothetical protein
LIVIAVWSPELARTVATAVPIDVVPPVTNTVARAVACPLVIAVTDLVAPMVHGLRTIVPVPTARGVVVDRMRLQVKSKKEQMGYGCNVLGSDAPELVFETRFEVMAGLGGSRPEQDADRESGGDPSASAPDAGGRSRGRHCLLDLEMSVH